MTPAEPTIPAGWRLVPEKATAAMEGAGAHMCGYDGHNFEARCVDAGFAYRDMLAAAPAYTPRTPEPTGDTREQVARMWVRWSDDGEHIRKWSREPFDGGVEFAALPPARDAEDRCRAFVHAYVKAGEAGIGTVYLIDQARTALSASDGKEGVS